MHMWRTQGNETGGDTTATILYDTMFLYIYLPYV